ncbi:hypothetical protein [Streptomyces sp. NBC_01445]|uniref:hypothetical protein n=1 Tax=Streptomyces sp. NBC_01445 TaxID=2903869 RepID=UPI002DDC2AC5|nr:hypothetical protein [Streptomyces sp. NBC_01445]WSE09757.1 hypothetical protein OG574_44205 [Streptomyces sp. NBC_01445]
MVETGPGRWFGYPKTAETPLGRALLRDLAESDPVGYAACCDAFAVYHLRSGLARITAPTLVVGCSLDTATPLDHARELADGIADATLEACAIGHLAVEQPEAVGAEHSSPRQAPGTDTWTPACPRYRVPPVSRKGSSIEWVTTWATEAEEIGDESDQQPAPQPNMTHQQSAQHTSSGWR